MKRIAHLLDSKCRRNLGISFMRMCYILIPRIDTVRRDDVMEIGGLDRIHIDLKF